MFYKFGVFKSTAIVCVSQLFVDFEEQKQHVSAKIYFPMLRRHHLMWHVEFCLLGMKQSIVINNHLCDILRVYKLIFYVPQDRKYMKATSAGTFADKHKNLTNECESSIAYIQ